MGITQIVYCGTVSFVAAMPAFAAESVELSGVFRNMAVLTVDGGPPRTVAVGERTRDGVKLVELSGNGALVEFDGRRQRLVLDATALRSAEPDASPAVANLYADSRGHHFGAGSINGVTVRFLVDTGASMVSLGASDARRAGIDYRRGVAARTQTANGTASVWQVRLDTVRLGDITLNGVDGLVHENDLPFVLLGMSFLNRMDMRRDGERLVLRRRY